MQGRLDACPLQHDRRRLVKQVSQLRNNECLTSNRAMLTGPAAARLPVPASAAVLVTSGIRSCVELKGKAAICQDGTSHLIGQ